jgi:hypothetical protein
LERDYIDRWLASETRSEPIQAPPVTIEDKTGQKAGVAIQHGYENPIRTAFTRTLREKPPRYPETLDATPDGTVQLYGDRLAFSIRFPFGDPVVGMSGFWSTPCWIAACACTILRSEEPQTATIELSVVGGITLWLDGTCIGKFCPYERNKPCTTTMHLPLQRGKNLLVAVFDDFAERDTECNFSVKVVEGKGSIVQLVPVGDRNPQALQAAENALGSLRFSSNHCNGNDLLLACDTSGIDEPLVLSLVGETEENRMLGIFHHASATFLPGSETASAGPCESFPIGFLRFRVTAKVEGITLCTTLTVENFPLSVLEPPADTVVGRKRQGLAFLATYGERNANRAVALLHEGRNPDEIETILQRQVKFINDRSDCSDFYLSYFPHIIREFGDGNLLSPTLLGNMKDCLLDFRYWYDEPGNDVMWFYSENHALMFHVCQLLAGELYPDEIFANSGMTGRQMQEKAIRMLRAWFSEFFEVGFAEWNSPPYLPIDSLGFASLYAQTSNREMKASAKRGLDFVFRLLACNSFRGVFSTTSGRTYLKELLGNRSNCTSFLNFIASGTGNPSHAGKGVVALCFSDYEPDPRLLQDQAVPEGEALLWQSTQGPDGYVDLYTYKTSRYLVSSAANFCVGQPGLQEDVFHLLFGANEQVWINHPGEFARFGEARPSYWAGNGTLPRVNQYRDFASVIFDVSESHPVPFTHAYLPVTEFAEVQESDDGHWVFALAHDGGMAAIYNSIGLCRQKYGPNTDREFISEGRKSIYLVRCREPGQGISFDSFVASMLAAPLAISPESAGYVFVDPEYGKMEASRDDTLSVDGKPMRYDGFTPTGTVQRFPTRTI